MALSLPQFAMAAARGAKKRPKGGGNPPVIRRDIPLARATFFGPGGPQAPKEKPQAAPTTDFSPKAWV